MRVPRVYANKADVYVYGKIIIQIILNPKTAGDASYTRVQERVRRVHMATNYLNNS